MTLTKDYLVKGCHKRKPVQPELERLHSLSSKNRVALAHASLAGCFYCLKIWNPFDNPIKEWVDREIYGEYDATALCPFCGVDSVLAAVEVRTLDKAILAKMHEYWF